MTDDPDDKRNSQTTPRPLKPASGAGQADPREDRRKAALKANMARRKAQAKARGASAQNDKT